MDRATQINQLHENFCEGVRTTVPIAIQIGELLVAQKEECDYGDWLPWIIANLHFTPRWAQIYIRCYRRRDLLNAKSASHLTTIDQFARAALEPEEQEWESKAPEPELVHFTRVAKPTPAPRRVAYARIESKPPQRQVFTLVAAGPPPPPPSKAEALDAVEESCRVARGRGATEDEIFGRVRAVLAAAPAAANENGPR